MSSTNKTPNLQLSQFIGTDKPTWLGDINGDMVKIDTGVSTAIETAENAEQSTSALQATVNGLNTTVSGHTSSISALQSAQTTQGNAINELNQDLVETDNILDGHTALLGNTPIDIGGGTVTGAIAALNSGGTNGPVKKTVTVADGITVSYANAFKNGNLVELEVKIPPNVTINNATQILTLPSDCRPSIATGFKGVGTAWVGQPTAPTDRVFAILAQALVDGRVIVANDLGIAMTGATFNLKFFIS